MVGDGFLVSLCGCKGAGESPGTVYPTPGGLTCHLASNSGVVLFIFSGTVLKHQIIPRDGKSFAPTPISDPSVSNSIHTFALSFPWPATTYAFQDVFSGMVGQIVVPK
jgi:hypothetical protein